MILSPVFARERNHVVVCVKGEKPIATAANRHSTLLPPDPFASHYFYPAF